MSELIEKSWQGRCRSIEWGESYVLTVVHYRFTKHQNDNVPGLSEAARTKRRNKNFVTMKFNLINFLMDTISSMLLPVFNSFFIRLFYFIVSYCGTPLVLEKELSKQKGYLSICYYKRSNHCVLRPVRKSFVCFVCPPPQLQVRGKRGWVAWGGGGKVKSQAKKNIFTKKNIFVKNILPKIFSPTIFF